MEVGERIRQLRIEKDWTQDELARRLGYKGGRATISKIESGENELNQTKLMKFAEVLGTNPAYLMGWDDIEEERKTNNFDAVMRDWDIPDADAQFVKALLSDERMRTRVRQIYDMIKEV